MAVCIAPILFIRFSMKRTLSIAHLASVVFAIVCLFTDSTAVWAQRNLTDIPAPDTKAEQAAMKLDPVAQVNLYAADPDITKPIQFNFDAQGRLWVATSEVYPQIKPGEKANDKIVVLEDTNRDGVMDRSTVFAEGLLIPTGLAPDGKGGCYVGASTELLHFADQDGDGKADKRTVVFSGFGTEDTHHLLHTFHWGPDGCLYFNQSIYIHSHIETAYGMRHLEGGGIWRYRPETGQLDVVCKGFVNPWGHVFDRYGDTFATDGAYSEGINYVFPGAVFVTAPGESRFLSGMNPGSPKHCGLTILSGTHIPPEWQGDYVTNDFRGHRVCRFTVAPNQSTYTSRQQPEIITTPHVAFRPIDAQMGPDGALYLADWYNPIIQHGEVDFRDPRRDRTHGRVWRVSFPGRQPDLWPDFKQATTDQLLSLLEAPSLKVRQFAREHLWPQVRENAPAVLSKVRAWRDAAPDDATKALRALEQQWLGEVAGEVQTDALELIQALPPGPVTRTALRSAARMASPDDPMVQAWALRLLQSDHAPSQLEAIVTLGKSSSNDAAVALVKYVQQTSGSLSGDRYLDFAAWQALRSTQNVWSAAVQAGTLDWQAVPAGLAYAVRSANSPQAASGLLDVIAKTATNTETLTKQLPLVEAVVATGNAQQLGTLLKQILDPKYGYQKPLVALVLNSLVARAANNVVPQDAEATLSAYAISSEDLFASPELARAVVGAAGAWRGQRLLPTLLAQAQKTDSLELKQEILKSLGSFDNNEAKAALAAAAAQDTPESHAALTAMVTKQPNEAAAIAANKCATVVDDKVAEQAMLSVVSNQTAAAAFPAAIKVFELDGNRARALLVAMRQGGGNQSIEAAILQAGKLSDTGWRLTAELSQELVEQVKAVGNPAAGESIYRRTALQCVICHAIGNAGGLVGPNLISVGGSSQPDYLVESLLEPNAKLKEGYTTLSVLTDDGRVVSGIPLSENDESIKLRLADGKELIIPQSSVEDTSPGKSLMPAGLVDTLSKKELVDLVAFLSVLGRLPEYTVSTRPIVRQYETLVFTPDGHSRLNRTSIDTVATDDPQLTWRPVTAMVNGAIPLEELDRLQPHREAPSASYLRFDIEVGQGQTPQLVIPYDHIQVWVDGKPQPPESLKDRQWTAGKHRIVVGILRDQFRGEWLAELK